MPRNATLPLGVGFTGSGMPRNTTLSARRGPASAAEFFAAGDSVRMVVTIDPHVTDEITRLATMGFTSQVTKLDVRFPKG